MSRYVITTIDPLRTVDIGWDEKERNYFLEVHERKEDSPETAHTIRMHCKDLDTVELLLECQHRIEMPEEVFADLWRDVEQ
jgi:hypothetical protein